MDDTLLGMMTDVKLVQYWKAPKLMLVTLFGMAIESKLVHS